MKTIEIQLYKFDELPKDIQVKVIQRYSDINLHDDWYYSIYEDAKNVGIKITGFDIDRGSYCDISAIYDWENIAERLIFEHGHGTDTCKLAEHFLNERDEIIDSAKRDENGDIEDENELDNLLDDLEDDFKKQLSECYLIMLRNEYEYWSSDDAIIDTIKNNEFDFTEDGKIY